MLAGDPRPGSPVAAVALVEYREIILVDVLLYNGADTAITIEPAMFVLSDFSQRPFQYLPPHEAVNRFMGAELPREAFPRKADYWLPNTDYGYPHIPESVSHSPERLAEALVEALDSALEARFAARPEVMADLIYREALTPGVVVASGMTLRFNVAWRNYTPKFYPLDIRVRVPEVRIRYQP